MILILIAIWKLCFIFNGLLRMPLLYTQWFINVKIQKKLSHAICVVLYVVVILVQNDDTEGGCL